MYVFSAAGIGAWAVQLVKQSGEAWTAAELQTDIDLPHIAESEFRRSAWSVFDGRSLTAAAASSLKLKVWRRPAHAAQQQARAAETARENECLRPAKVQSVPALGYAFTGDETLYVKFKNNHFCLCVFRDMRARCTSAMALKAKPCN
jgi:hypothetical protein